MLIRNDLRVLLINNSFEKLDLPYFVPSVDLEWHSVSIYSVECNCVIKTNQNMFERTKHLITLSFYRTYIVTNKKKSSKPPSFKLSQSRK